MANSLLPQLFFSDRANSVLRGALFVYLGLVFCPIQYFVITTGSLDDTWLFALNYAAAHHLALGCDIVWTSGPLGYLAAPMDIGNNLAQGLAFQAALWVLLLAILWDVFFRGRFPLRNLAFFSICLGLAGFMYHQSSHQSVRRGRLAFCRGTDSAGALSVARRLRPLRLRYFRLLKRH